MKQKIILALWFICSELIFNSCEKDGNQPNDFRDKYVGKYKVTEKISCYGSCSSCLFQRDTIISVNYGLTDSTLNILGRDVFPDSAGNYHSYHYDLRLWKDSIFSTFINGGLGCGKYETYKGIRISDKP